MQKNKLVYISRFIVSSISFIFLFVILLSYHSFLTLCAGICVFLFAMILLQDAFKVLSGGILDRILDKVADKNYKAFIFGFTLSTIVQSSGLVSVIAISFLSASLISLQAGVAMIYGVNLSTAFSAWIVGYFGLKSEISLYAMPLIIFGVILYFNKDKTKKHIGLFVLSLGFLFLGISYMKEGFENFKDSVDISKYQMQGFLGLIVYVFIGIIITSLTQSSHATLTLAITALSVSQVSYENAVALAIGANIGSTIMTVIGSIGSNAQGKKITATHVLFNVIAAFISIIFIKYYLLATDYLATILDIKSDDYVLKLALFTTLFNVIAVILLYPFIKQMCFVLDKFIKEKRSVNNIEKSIYLNDSALEFADSAKEVLLRENKNLFEKASFLIATSINVKEEDIVSTLDVNQLIKERNKDLDLDFDELYRLKFKNLYSEIIDFIVRSNTAHGYNEQANIFVDLKRASLFMAASVKEAKELHINVKKYAFSNNQALSEEYSHLRRNILRLLRLSKQLLQTESKEDAIQLREQLDFNVKKYDAISSNSLDSLIRYKRITDTMATSIMNDTAIARSIAKDLIHACDILCSID
ncbi:Na/Pi symporter [uncultured Campylobacter sp.]|uniref:Na/Pi cotransporter family protein n=1 Tax=uncultured Campylobacter sp. TaxID=218934 RepID=UPI002638EA2E|nr:Na/Pi symporter [uncultured Campylobacter sp.]